MLKMVIINMEFETLDCSKFTRLNREEMLLVKGGEDTGAGREIIGTWDVNLPCESTAGGVTYQHTPMTKIRTWTSDASIDGRMCYWGEGYGWVTPGSVGQ